MEDAHNMFSLEILRDTCWDTLGDVTQQADHIIVTVLKVKGAYCAGSVSRFYALDEESQNVGQQLGIEELLHLL